MRRNGLGMNKDDFRSELRKALYQVPLEARKTWKERPNLFLWWTETQFIDPNLTWTGARGPLWEHVKGMCSDLIGKDATL